MEGDTLSFSQDIANIIKGIAYYDITIENMKIKAAENPNFDAEIAWKQLDIKNIQSIDVEYLSSFLSANRIAASAKECKYLIDFISQNDRIVCDQFIDYILPKKNFKLKQQSLQRRAQYGVGKHAKFYSDRTLARSSEIITAGILLAEIQGFRDIEQTRKELRKSCGLNVQQIFKLVDYDQKGIIDEDVLKNFMKRTGVTFNNDEFEAFITRTTEDGDRQLSYEELILSILPIDPFTYPHYRERFDAVANNEKVIRKAAEFKTSVTDRPTYFIDTNPTNRKIFVQPQEEEKYNTFDQPIRQFFNPNSQGKPTYSREEGYMKQLKSYQEKFYNPSREGNVQYTNRFQGIRYHDQHFDGFYKFLHDREQNEQLFNKFGKRYTFDDDLNRVREQISSKMFSSGSLQQFNTQPRDQPIFANNSDLRDTVQLVNNRKKDREQANPNKYSDLEGPSFFDNP